ncbi:glutaredoxin family protein [Evansella clarkii]|jgi:thiol-disulfide isomerase/thioredoxin|uniref:glutaredoxin family protein n=1 Tax=Evansella clarkii TaxID=79879 RepID=UPI0009983507|nr:glutaredoxin family protein [Evansella clarkii]
MKLYFYTKTGCPLCDKGLDVTKDLQKKYSFEIIERDIYSNEEWLELYQIRIPVVEDENGYVLEEGIISSPALEKKINERV